MNRREILKIAAAIMGAGLSGSLSQNVLAGLSPTAKPSRAIFNANSSKTVAVLAEMIIPKTDTPGAIEAGAPAFIEMMVADWFNDDERKIFFAGMASLDDFCKEQFKKSFLACDEEQRTAALKDSEKSALSYKSAAPAVDISQKYVDPNTPFFTKLKELTVLGYFTSEVGAKQALSYNPMPMRYEGDYDFDKVGREWSW
ncbi:MAG TPA: gluconate 2-dehydrogenase subunit 3 family protein [Spongiibacteraceae bacterium]|nr:gluconate 2-dehydrogenase subunit 3 family protein [Spongiibacteraceae bacterium]